MVLQYNIREPVSRMIIFYAEKLMNKQKQREIKEKNMPWEIFQSMMDKRIESIYLMVTKKRDMILSTDDVKN